MNLMPSFIRDSGVFGPALVVLGLTVLILSVRGLWSLGRSSREGGEPIRQRIDSILFWGVASAVIGILGQCEGAYLALSTILAASEISPAVVAQGFVISFFPTLFGFGILTFAAVAWACLRFLSKDIQNPS